MLIVGVRSKSRLSFLFESAATTETIGRYSFIGAGRYLNKLPAYTADKLQTLAKSSRPARAMAKKPIHYPSSRRNSRRAASRPYPRYNYLL